MTFLKNTKTNGKKRKTRKTSKVNNIKKDIYGIIIIAFGLLSMLSLFSSKMGIIGSIVAGTTFSFMGFGAYFFPLVIIFSGIIFIVDKFNNKEKKIILAALLIFISFLILFDGSIPSNYKLFDRIKNSISLSKTSKGGGIIGSFLDISSTNYLVQWVPI